MRERTIKLQVWLYPKEAERLTRCANLTNMSKSAYIRNLITGHEPKAFPPTDYFKVLRELRAIGNNLNQIALRANEHGYLHHEEYRKRHAELAQLTDELTKVFLPRREDM